MHLVSLKNPRVKQVVRLRDRRGRDREERMIIEGYRCLRRALANHVPIDELYVCEELFQGENEQALISALAEQGATVFTTTEPVFRKMAYRDRPEGLLGLAPQLRRSLADLPDSAPPPLYLVAEAIEKPGNLGTMLRTCDATGVTGLILCDPCTDLFNPNVVRASTGSVFSVPVAEATADEAFAWLANGGVRVLAATPHADRLYTEVDLSGPLAIAVGAEQYGLSQEWLDRADLQVRIPMLGQADSLNVATATALLLYEAVRQRMEAGVVARPREAPNAH
ncbi:MAG: RNA methyltransferase [Lentisphaeria bacterium]|nr:RNA methyltransferase [Lentisphaeria bacterium]